MTSDTNFTVIFTPINRSYSCAYAHAYLGIVILCSHELTLPFSLSLFHNQSFSFSTEVSVFKLQ